jgi:UDP-N-acetylmuramate--alanine ligase
LHHHPDIAVISSMDADHLDIYGAKNELQNTFFSFIENIKDGGTLFLQNELPLPADIKVEVLKYGLSNEADIIAKSMEIKEGKHLFNISYCNEELGNFALSLPGQHNMLNATVSVAIANKLSAKTDALREAVNTYKGVARRFEILLNSNYVLIDDYAHHPVEINAAISATRQMFPDKNLTAVFQPHLFTRTRDFADDFARELSKVDNLILLDIYPARELPIEGIDSQMLIDEITINDKRILSKEGVLDYFENNKTEITLIMGAGDIDRLVQPIKNILENA